MTEELLDETHVSFRFIGPQVDPDEVTSCLGLDPTEAHKVGESDPKHPKGARSTGFWTIDSGAPVADPIEVHISRLLDQLEPRSEALAELRGMGYAGNLYCSYFMSQESGRINLDSFTLSRIASLLLTLTIDTYRWNHDEGD